MGESFVREIVLERESNGNYNDIFDFCLRLEKKYLNRRAIEALIYSGAFDIFGVKRAILIATYPRAIKQAEQRQNDFSKGQVSLFSEVESHIEYEKKYMKGEYLPLKKELMLEKSVMGYYLDRHPTDLYKADLKPIVCTLPKDIVFRNNREVRILALISEVNYRKTQRGQMASLIIEDGVKKINAVLFSQALGANSDQLILDEVVVISGKVNKDFRDQWQVVIDHIEPVEKVQVKYAKYLKLSLSKNNKLEYVEICQLLKEFHGKCPVMIEYHSNNASGNIPLKSEYDVSLQRDLLDALDKNLGPGKYKIQY